MECFLYRILFLFYLHISQMHLLSSKLKLNSCFFVYLYIFLDNSKFKSFIQTRECLLLCLIECIRRYAVHD